MNKGNIRNRGTITWSGNYVDSSNIGMVTKTILSLTQEARMLPLNSRIQRVTQGQSILEF